MLFGLLKVCEGIVEVLPFSVKPVMPLGEIPDQENDEPVTDEVRFTDWLATPSQIVWARLALVTDGIG